MTPTKELFLKRAELRKSLLAINKTDWFGEVCVFAFNLATEVPVVSAEYIDGVRTALTTLQTMADEEPGLPEAITSGIRHDFETAKREKPSTK